MAYTSDQLDLLTAVGKALANWSGVELQLCSLFQSIADIPDMDKSRALFDGIISFEVRLAIIDQIMPFEEAEPIETAMWFRMSARLTKQYKKRHELAHFALFQDDKRATVSPFLTLDKWTRGEHRFLEVGQIDERGAKFMETFSALDWFVTRARIRRDMPIEDREPLDPEPPLVPRLRELATRMLAEQQPRPRS